MGYYLHFLAISLGWSLLCCDASVTVSLINSANGVDTLECRSDGIISCRINPYANLMNWVINGTIYVTCSPGCIVNPSITRNYNPTYDFTNGVFNLTVDSATYNDDSTTFKCDDGSLSKNITTEVVPAYSEYKTSINDTDKQRQVEFTTACVQPGVEFVWFTVKMDNSYKETYNIEKKEMRKTTECSLDSDCGGDGTGKVTSTITIPTLKGGEERYLEVVVKYKNPVWQKTYRFDETFRFKDCKLPCCAIIFFIYLAIYLQLLTSYFAGSLLCALYQNNPSEISAMKIFILFLACFPFIGIFVAIVLCVLRLELSKDMKTSCWVFVGYLPLIGTFFNAYFVFGKQKENFHCRNCSNKCEMWMFIIFGIFDVGFFVVMILSCIDIIGVRCYMFAVYALIALVLSWMNFVCRAVLLQTENNKIEEKVESSCHSCKHTKAELKCIECDEKLCRVCTGKHLEKGIHDQTLTVNTVLQTNYINNQNSSLVHCCVCDEYLCTWCFFLHLNLKQLWQQQQFDQDFLERTAIQVNREYHIKRFEKRNSNNAPLKWIFLGCFPVFGVFVIICTLRKKNEQEGNENYNCVTRNFLNLRVFE